MSWQERLRTLSIPVRFRLVFAVVIVMTILGASFSFWHFRSVTSYAARISLAERRSAAVLRLNTNLLSLTNGLYRAADRQMTSRFEAEAFYLARAFETQSTDALSALREMAQSDSRYTVLIGGVLTMIESMPKRISSLAQLARHDDWQVLHARLLNEADQTDDVMAALMTRLDVDLVEARAELTEDLAKAQQRAVYTLLAAATISLALAILLGASLTTSITAPLSRLAQGGRALAAGDLTRRVPADGNDELTELTRDFNRTFTELERLFKEVEEGRTIAQTAQRSLEKHAEQLARANTDLQQFAYSASHDLQEPLRVILLYGEILQRRWGKHLDPDATQSLEFVCNGARQMQQLIDDLLAYSRAGYVDQAVESPVDVNVVLDRVLGVLQVPIETERCQIRTSRVPVAVMAHEIHVQQLLQNLIGNAIKYRSQDRNPEVEVLSEQKNGFLEIAVRDNGIGIDPQYSKQVFGMFKRLHGQRYPGTGIGLAICKRIVESYGGQIWVESVPRVGSTFKLTLPVEETAAPNGKI